MPVIGVCVGGGDTQLEMFLCYAIMYTCTVEPLH